MPCNLVESTEASEETAIIIFRGGHASDSSEASAPFCQVTHRRVLEDSMFTKIKTKKKTGKEVMNENEWKESKHKETWEDGTLTWL